MTGPTPKRIDGVREGTSSDPARPGPSQADTTTSQGLAAGPSADRRIDPHYVAHPASPYSRWGKPVLDRTTAGVALLVLSPLLGLIALAVAAESPGGPFFRQARVGRDGRSFRLLKFRSMVSGAEHAGAGALVEHGDRRITRAGKLLRATSIDEIPQLWNVLRGDMSLIGPRPTLEYQVRQYDDFQRQRLLVKPGITGLAQVRGRKSLSWPDRIRADVEYVERMSLWLDLSILIRTPMALFGGEGQAHGDYWKERGSGPHEDG